MQVAEYAQFPPEVVRLAKRKASELEASTDGGDAAYAKRAKGSGNGEGVRAALAGFATLPLAYMDPQQVVIQTRRLLAQVMAV